MARLRPELDRRLVPTAAGLQGTPSGRRARYVGMVICRQRPQTASGVVFMTLEDETGFVNLVVWRRVFDRFEAIAKTAVLLEVEGEVQSEHGVTHLVAETLAVPRVSSRGAATSTDARRAFRAPARVVATPDEPTRRARGGASQGGGGGAPAARSRRRGARAKH